MRGISFAMQDTRVGKLVRKQINTTAGNLDFNAGLPNINAHQLN